MATVWCQPCGIDGRQVAATVKVDGDPMCKPCAHYIQAEMVRAGNARLPEEPLGGKPAAPEVRFCARGCGAPVHRGCCKGDGDRKSPAAVRRLQLPGPIAKVLAKAPLEGLSAPRRRGLMDTLISEVVRDEDIPEEAAIPRTLGRIGEIWKAMDELRPGCSLRVANRDRQHCTYTLRHLRRGEKERKVQLLARVVGSDLYVRLSGEGEQA